MWMTPSGSVEAQQAPAAAPRLPLYPLDIAVTPEGVAYVVDRNLPGVWQWKDGQLTEYFKGSPKYRTPLNAPRCVAIDKDGSLLVGDSATREVYRFTTQGEPQPITGGKIGIPMDLAVAADGTIYVADLELRMLLRIAPGTSEVEQVAAVNPRGVFIDGNDRIWVVSQDAQQLQIVQPDGKTQVIVGERIFEFPHQVVVNEAGEAFVTDGYKKAVWKIAPGGSPEILIEGGPLDNPVGLTLHEDQLRIVDPRAQSVFRLTAEKQLEVWFEIKP